MDRLEGAFDVSKFKKIGSEELGLEFKKSNTHKYRTRFSTHTHTHKILI